jgi:hypothetical protein
MKFLLVYIAPVSHDLGVKDAAHTHDETAFQAETDLSHMLFNEQNSCLRFILGSSPLPFIT